MIRPEYVELLKQHRADNNPEWGGSAVRYAGGPVLGAIEKRPQVVSVLDFGAGMGTLGRFIAAAAPNRELEWCEYDPSVDGIDTLEDRQYDMIVSTDVLEHVEPDEIDDTLDWLNLHAKYTQVHHIACYDVPDRLPDGRSAHLIVESPEWWLRMTACGGWPLFSKTTSTHTHTGRRDKTHVTIVMDRRY